MGKKKRTNKVKTTKSDTSQKVERDFAKTIQAIAENYKNMEKSIVNQLCLQTPDHAPTTGSYREMVWKSLFETIIPRKYCIEQGVFIIDSFGKISKEVDLAVFDEMYTPYIFNYGKIKFIPIEAVAVAIQCKSTNLRGVANWVKSIQELKTSLNSVVRIISDLTDNETDKRPKTQTSTRPILILCTTANVKKGQTIDKLFDITLGAHGGELNKTIHHEDRHYGNWCMDLNHYGLDRYGNDSDKYKKLCKDTSEFCTGRNLANLKVQKDGEENVIMSLTFQLNQLIMLVNNPMAFPHQAYAEMFNRELKKKEGEGGKSGGK